MRHAGGTCRRQTSRNWYSKAAVGAAIQLSPTGMRSTGCGWSPCSSIGASARRNSLQRNAVDGRHLVGVGDHGARRIGPHHDRRDDETRAGRRSRRAGRAPRPAAAAGRPPRAVRAARPAPASRRRRCARRAAPIGWRGGAGARRAGSGSSRPRVLHCVCAGRPAQLAPWPSSVMTSATAARPCGAVRQRVHGKAAQRVATMRFPQRRVVLHAGCGVGRRLPAVAQFAQLDEHRACVRVLRQVGETLAQPGDQRSGWSAGRRC